MEIVEKKIILETTKKVSRSEIPDPNILPDNVHDPSQVAAFFFLHVFHRFSVSPTPSGDQSLPRQVVGMKCV